MEVDRELAVPWSNLHPQVDMTWLHEFHKSQVDIRQSSKTLAILSIPYPWGKKKKQTNLAAVGCGVNFLG